MQLNAAEYAFRRRRGKALFGWPISSNREKLANIWQSISLPDSFLVCLPPFLLPPFLIFVSGKVPSVSR